jgi:ADP-ribose pyrophosphatase YjhB (NUDIX family)
MLFIEDWRQRRIEREQLSSESYTSALNSMILVCTDVLLVKAQEKLVLLVKRIRKPMKDEWWFIGGRRRAFKTILESVILTFQRETTLNIYPERFVYIGDFEFMFKDRHQEPQAMGTHTLSHTFALELDGDELDQVEQNLDKGEYESKLQPFTLKNLYENKVHGAVIEAYKRFFLNPLEWKYRHFKVDGF